MALFIAGLSKAKGSPADKPSPSGAKNGVDSALADELFADVINDKKDSKERARALRAFIKATMKD
jgi:hypothetical protein